MHVDLECFRETPRPFGAVWQIAVQTGLTHSETSVWGDAKQVSVDFQPQFGRQSQEG